MNDFKRCCVVEINRICASVGGSMNVVRYEGNCPDCGHYIGLTQTDKETMDELNKKYNIK